MTKFKVINTETFKIRAEEKHGNRYNYEKSDFINSTTPLVITCEFHGDFTQRPTDHNSGKGCKLCSIDSRASKDRMTTDEFVSKANKAHNSKYNYSRSIYGKNASDKIIIICPHHGEFFQTPKHHLSGHGCLECGNNRGNKFKQDTKDSFLKKVKEIHENTYDYSKVNYLSSVDKIEIICKKHGSFYQAARNHLNAQQGCPKCMVRRSKGEKELYKFLKQYTPCKRSDRKILETKELDIYIAPKKIAIEYNGLYFHSEKFKDKTYHLEKTEECLKRGVQLIHLFEDEWKNKKDIVKSRLLNLLGQTPNKVYARKTQVKHVSARDASKFLEENHTQGKVGGKIKLGLYYNDELISLMTFGELRANLGSKKTKDSYELIRFVNKIYYINVGGASKLFKYFVRNYKPTEVISYADRRWSTGNLYYELGFKLISTSKPNYFYTDGNMRYNRYPFRKSELIKAGFDKNSTERKIMLDRGFLRIYDCGTLKFSFKTNKK